VTTLKLELEGVCEKRSPSLELVDLLLILDIDHADWHVQRVTDVVQVAGCFVLFIVGCGEFLVTSLSEDVSLATIVSAV